MMLKRIFLGKAKKLIAYALKVNDYVAILIGLVITIIVQSSSATTSALTPLCGVGVLPLNKMLPLTLGANIGTTCTALIACLVSLKFGAVQIALVHLFFNIIGISIWFPVPLLRRIPLAAARLLGLYASYFRFVPALYIFTGFVVVPGVCLLMSELFKASIAGGMIVLLVLLGLFSFFEVAWWRGIPLGKSPLDGMPICMKVLTKEQREEGTLALEAANAKIMGLDAETPKGNAAATSSPISEVIV